MEIEIWSDVVCGWCYLGKRRLERALQRFDGRDEVRLVYRAFELDPTRPVGTTESVQTVLHAKYGWTPAQVEAAGDQIQALAAEEGLVYRRTADGVIGNTRHAHEVMHAAVACGRGDAMLERLYRAYFTEGRSVFDVESLVALAADVGLDEADLRVALREGRYTAAVEADNREARALGARGVPFFVIDRRFGVSGAQSVDVFVEALTRAREARSANDATKSA
jgi:predicted DsbA family dithiol-disulfide isomerase